MSSAAAMIYQVPDRRRRPLLGNLKKQFALPQKIFTSAMSASSRSMLTAESQRCGMAEKKGKAPAREENANG
jgi:hypothetical protein